MLGDATAAAIRVGTGKDYANDIIISMQLSISPPAFPLLIARYPIFFSTKLEMLGSSW